MTTSNAVTVETRVISKTDSFVGCYADLNGDGQIVAGEDGIIYADLAVGDSGTVNDISTLKDYYVSQESCNAGLFGTDARRVISLMEESSGTKDRFYVMALRDFTDGTNTLFCWYAAAENNNMSDYSTYTSTAFGKGKENTEKMITKWKAKGYGGQNYGDYPDLWGAIQTEVTEGWFVPSKCEWDTFAQALGLTDENYVDYGTSKTYWSSSQQAKNSVYGSTYSQPNGMTWLAVWADYPARLSITF